MSNVNILLPFLRAETFRPYRLDVSRSHYFRFSTFLHAAFLMDSHCTDSQRASPAGHLIRLPSLKRELGGDCPNREKTNGNLV